jgi:hypothetical protein
MGHQPTIFYILENQTLGTWWVGKMESTLDGCGMPPYRSITQDQLNEKLSEKYHNPNAYLTLVTLNKRWSACYGVERWLSKLEYKINKEPEKYRELEKLLKAGWDDDIETSTLSVLHVLEHNQPINKIFKKLVTSREGLTRCLNTYTGKTRAEKYQGSKKDPDFMYKRARKEVLRNMEKTGKLPKPETLAKYEIKEDELREIMGPKGIIYKITSPSGKAYVGQTMRSFERRVAEHKRESSRCTLLKRAIQKYGDEMKYEIIEDNVPQEQMNAREIYWINHFNSLAPSGYNLNSGGGAPQIISQEAKDRVQMGKIKSKVEKDGYMGDIRKSSDDTMFYPRIRRRGKHISLSTGGFRTEEEAIEVLREYTRYPENFTTVENRHISRVGSVYPTKNRLAWILEYKRGNYLGTYKTQEEAWKALERYIEDPVNFSREHRKIGSVRPKGNRWIVSCKGEYLGHYITEEEGYKALEEYNKDPEKFLKGRIKLSGSIFKSGDKWRFNYKGKHIGYYHTKEEAEEARQALQSS